MSSRIQRSRCGRVSEDDPTRSTRIRIEGISRVFR